MLKKIKTRLCNQRGFTLIELTLVVLLLGLLANLSLPLISGFETDRMNATARRLSGTVKYLYNEAIITGREQRLIFDLSQGTYRTVDIAENGDLTENTGLGRLYRLPQMVRFESIYQPRRGEKNAGEVTTAILSGGWMEETIIHLIDEDERKLTLRLVPLTGLTEFYDGYRDFR